MSVSWGLSTEAVQNRRRFFHASNLSLSLVREIETQSVSAISVCEDDSVGFGAR